MVGEFPPLVHGCHGGGGAGAPPRLDLSLSLFSSVSSSCFLVENRFLYSRISITPIGLKFWGDFYPKISLIAPEGELQPTYEVGTRQHHAFGPLGRALMYRGGCGSPFALIPLLKIQKYSKNNLRKFLLCFDFVWYGNSMKQKSMQQTGTGTGHWINMLVQ